MKEQKNFLSIMAAKLHEGESQNFFVCVEPNASWLQNSPHKFCGDAEVFGELTYQNHAAEVVATVRIPMEFVCDKCASKFQKNLLAQTHAVFEEIEDDDPDDFALQEKIIANRINLVPVVRDAVYESLPTQVLCKENCKGLCPKCGENLNFASCRCKK